MKPDSNSEPTGADPRRSRKSESVEGDAEFGIDPTIRQSRAVRVKEAEALQEAPDVPDVNMTGVLGRGGQGVVYRGHQEFLDRKVAVKVLHRSVERDLARFRREATILAKIQHPNVVACFQAGVTSENQCYMVLEYVDGEDLFRYVKRNGPLSEDSALALVADVALGLQHGYETCDRMIHRDVKPQNVLLQISEEGPGPRLKGKIVDLGLARCLEESMELTVQGAVMGTPSTMAPEQYDDPDDVDHRTDIYGLGCVLFFALTGDTAFKGATLTAIYRQKTSNKPIRPHSDLDLCPGTHKLLDAMLARTQDARPATYDELLGLIRNVRADLRQVPAGNAKSRKKAAWIGAGVAAVAVAGVGAFLLPKGDPEGPGQVSDPPLREALPTATSEVEEKAKSDEQSPDPQTPIAEDLSPQDVASPIEDEARVTAPTESDATVQASGAAEPSPEPELELATAPPAIDIPLSGALVPGATMPLWPIRDPFGDWWTTGEAADSAPEADLWQLIDGYPRGVPKRAFENLQGELQARRELLETRSPIPLFLPGCNAISHKLPEGATGLRGRIVLQKMGLGKALAGGLVLRRRDGSMLELDLVFNFPEGVKSGKSAKRWATLRAAWFSAGGEPLNTRSSAAALQKYAFDEETGAETAGDWLSSLGPDLKSSDMIAADIQIRISTTGYELSFGDGLVSKWSKLRSPDDIEQNEFCELIAFSRRGWVFMRDIEFFGIEDK